jgi:hypothetical protein
MPESVKILITAAVGALVGIFSNIAMEYVKPWIAKQNLRKTITAQLAAELMDNLSLMEAADRMFKATKHRSESEQQHCILFSKTILSSIKNDRYTFYFEGEKSLVYEIDEGKTLTAFYELTKDALPDVLKDKQFVPTAAIFEVGCRIAREYVVKHQLVYKPTPSIIENIYMTSKSASSVPLTDTVTREA